MLPMLGIIVGAAVALYACQVLTGLLPWAAARIVLGIVAAAVLLIAVVGAWDIAAAGMMAARNIARGHPVPPAMMTGITSAPRRRHQRRRMRAI